VGGCFFILGIFLALQTLILSQADLEKPLTSLHLSFLAALGAFLFGALKSNVGRLSLIGITVASGLLSLGLSLFEVGPVSLGAGWTGLIGWSSYAAFRGGML
jgi:hypothetical protein